MKKNLSNYKKIDAILRKCQKRLRLQDWNIELVIANHGDMEPGRVAECRYSFRNMEAVVRVLNPEHNHEHGLGFDNLEATLYHELLHIIITPVVDDKVSEEWHEQVVERIAKALANI